MDGGMLASISVRTMHGAGFDTSLMIGSVSTADGSALIRMGEKTMVCGIKAEIAEPDSARPNEGFISRSLATTR